MCFTIPISMQGARVPHLFPGDKDSVVDGIEDKLWRLCLI